MQRGSLSIRSWRTQCGWGYSLAVMTQTVKEYLACSWQLTADGFYPHTGFPHHVYSSFVRLRITISVFCHCGAFPQSSFRALARIPCEKDGNQQCVIKRRIYYSGNVLPISLPRVADPSRSFRMTFNVSLIMTLFHPIVILNGGKNALWEKRKRNSGTEWRIYYTNDVLPSSSPWQ